jgi:hypothetical protein
VQDTLIPDLNLRLAATTLAPWAAVAAVLVLPVWLTMRRRRLVRARSPG